MLSTNGNLQGLWIRKLSSNLNITMEKYMPFIDPHSMAPTADGGFIVGATGDLGNAKGGNGLWKNEGLGGKAFLVKFSAALSLERVSVYGGASDDGHVNFGPFVGAAVQTADGGYGFATCSGSYGPMSDSNRPDWWTVKVDQYGRIQNFKDRMADVTSRYTIGAPPAVVQPREVNHSLLQPLIREGVAPDLLLTNVAATVRSQAAVASTPDLSPTQAFSVSSSGYQIHNPWQFTAYLDSAASGRKVRVQYANAPVIEGRWADLPGGGQMHLVDPAAGLWELRTTQPIPDSSSLQYISFRTISTAPGFSATVSEFSQIFPINASVPSQPPVVTMTAPVNGATINFEDGFTVTANISSAVHVSTVALLINNSVTARSTAGSFAVAAKSLLPVTTVSPFQ